MAQTQAGQLRAYEYRFSRLQNQNVQVVSGLRVLQNELSVVRYHRFTCKVKREAKEYQESMDQKLRETEEAAQARLNELRLMNEADLRTAKKEASAQLRDVKER